MPVPKDAVELTPAQVRRLPTDELKRTVLMSRLAYWDEKSVLRDSRVNDELRPDLLDGFPRVITSSDSHNATVYLWLMRSTSTLYIAFRGSGNIGESLTDVFANRREMGVHEKKGLVHGGILSQFDAIEPVLRGLIEQHQSDYTNLVFTGHGVGGGLATLAAPFVAEMHADKTVSCFTYGSPRVGDEDFCGWFNAKIRNKFRIVIEGDPLANMPASSRFSHVHDAVCLTSEGALQYWPETPANQRWDIPFGSLVMYIVTVFVHTQWEYVERVNAACSDVHAAQRGG